MSLYTLNFQLYTTKECTHIKIIAFDLGKVRTGVAVSDAGEILASPAEVIAKSDPAAVLEAAVNCVAKHNAGMAVVGLPLRDTGADGELAPWARNFARELGERCKIEVRLYDERYTTAAAHVYYNEAGKHGSKNRRKTIDAAAAAVILQNFLDRQKMRTGNN